MQERTILLIAVVLSCVGVARAEDAKGGAAETRAAIQRSLPYLEREGVAWMEQKKCVSCHNVAFLIWSHNAAAAAGVAVDAKKIAEWTDWSWRFSKTRRSATRPLEVDNDGGGLDTMNQLLLGRGTAAAGKGDEFVSDRRGLILRWQQPDGSWKAAGQLPSQSRPKLETDTASTLWTILALSQSDAKDAATQQTIARARNSVNVAKGWVSNEPLVCRMLIEQRFGEPQRASELLAQLLRRQNQDGGWAWKQGGSSDAFATGQVLYGLTQCVSPDVTPAIGRARQYLLSSQSADGWWAVPPSAISSADKEARLKKLEPIYQYWGTAWAVIGLSGTVQLQQ